MMKDYSKVLLLVLGLFLLSGLIYIWQDASDYTTLKNESINMIRYTKETIINESYI